MSDAPTLDELLAAEAARPHAEAVNAGGYLPVPTPDPEDVLEHLTAADEQLAFLLSALGELVGVEVLARVRTQVAVLVRCGREAHHLAEDAHAQRSRAGRQLTEARTERDRARTIGVLLEGRVEDLTAREQAMLARVRAAVREQCGDGAAEAVMTALGHPTTPPVADGLEPLPATSAGEPRRF